jgi:hypothetical protein
VTDDPASSSCTPPGAAEDHLTLTLRCTRLAGSEAKRYQDGVEDPGTEVPIARVEVSNSRAGLPMMPRSVDHDEVIGTALRPPLKCRTASDSGGVHVPTLL